MFSKGCRRIVVVTPLIIPYMPFSLIISIYYQQLEQHPGGLPGATALPSSWCCISKRQLPLACRYFLLQMNKRKSIALISHYLRDSPASNLRKYQQLFPTYEPDKKVQSETPSDAAYIQNFLRSVEVFGTPVSMLKVSNSMSVGELNKILGSNRGQQRRNRYPPGEADQIIQCVKDMNNLNRSNLSDYQELQQRLVIADPSTISAVKVKLIYFFKILLNRRQKLPHQSLELEANVHLTEAIFSALNRHPEFNPNAKQWSELQALEKLSRAREYKKNGLSKLAINSFEQIFRDEAAAFQTRLQALKVLCAQGEQQGDTTVLQPLVSLVREKGEKEYEEYLKLVIERIKSNEQKPSGTAK